MVSNSVLFKGKYGWDGIKCLLTGNPLIVPYASVKSPASARNKEVFPEPVFPFNKLTLPLGNIIFKFSTMGSPLGFNTVALLISILATGLLEKTNFSVFLFSFFLLFRFSHSSLIMPLLSSCVSVPKSCASARTAVIVIMPASRKKNGTNERRVMSPCTLSACAIESFLFLR